MQNEEEKRMTELKRSLALTLAFEETRNPFHFVGWFGRFLFSRWFRSSSKSFFEDYMEGRTLKAEAWRKKHADPLFGLPDEDYGWLEFTCWTFSKAPFQHARSSTVKVRSLGQPSSECREMFLWLERNILTIRDIVPDLLIEEAKFNNKTECYGEVDAERAAVAFAPEGIFCVEFLEEQPEQWEIRSYHPIDQDVYVTIQGSNETVTRAFLSM
jgi:hypothetical protein